MGRREGGREGGSIIPIQSDTVLHLRAYSNVTCVSSSGKLGQVDCGDHCLLGRNEMHISLSLQSSLPIVLVLQHCLERRRISGIDRDISFPVVCAYLDNHGWRTVSPFSFVLELHYDRVLVLLLVLVYRLLCTLLHVRVQLQ